LGKIIAVILLPGLFYAVYLFVGPYITPYSEDTLLHVVIALFIEWSFLAILIFAIIKIVFCRKGRTLSSVWAEGLAKSRQKVAQDKATAAEKEKLITATTTLAGILSVVHQTPTVFKYYSQDKTVGIAVDGEAGQVMFAVRDDDLKVSMRRYPFSDILAVDLLQDGSSISRTQTNRLNQLGGVLVGGVLLGGIGVLVGGLTGGSKTKTTDVIERIDMVVTVNDAERPSYVINFYRRSWADLAGNVKTGAEEAREWVARIKVVMHAEDLKDKNNRPSLTQAAPALSVSDELRKLISLHQDGLIDDDELAKQRARLLV